jgi:hypothetical protein
VLSTIKTLNLPERFLKPLPVFTALLIGACAQPMNVPDAKSPGAEAFVSRCSTCHSLPAPQRHSAQEWEHMVGVMEKRMRERKVPPLTQDERKLILGYLTEHSR